MSKAGPSKGRNPNTSGSESDHSEDSEKHHSQDLSGRKSPTATLSSKKDAKKETKDDDEKKNKGHFKKYWKYYAIGVVLGLAILLPLFFKVFIPLIIARFINSRNILVQHASVYIRSSTEIDFTANASVASPMAARVGDLEFTLHDLAVDEPPTVLTADIKGFEIQKATKIDIPQSTLHVNDPDALVTWADRFIDSDTIPFDVRVSGLDVFLGLLRYTFNLARPISINGLRGLADITLNDVALVLPPVDDKNVRANISFSNPSSLSVKVGNVTVDLAVNDLHIGQALAYDVSLVPGTTHVHIDGLVDIPLILNSLGGIVRGQAAQLQAGYVSLKLQVTGFNMHGEQIEFLGALLRKRVLVAKVPLMALINGAGTSIVKSGLVGMGMVNGTMMGETTLLDAIGNVLSNKTLLDRIQGHWARKRARDQYRYTRT